LGCAGEFWMANELNLVELAEFHVLDEIPQQ